MYRIFTNILINIIKFFINLIESIEYRNISLDEDDINKKIINSINTFGLKVKTDTGYEELSQLHITQPYIHYKLKTEKYKLECADNHIVFDKDYNEVFVPGMHKSFIDLMFTENNDFIK